MRGLRSKILFVTLLPLFFILLLISGLTINNKIDTERQLLLQRLSSYRTLLESGDLAFDSSQDKTKLEAILDEKVEFTEILHSDYSVLYTTENSASALVDAQDKKDIDDAFNGIETTKNIQYNGKSAFVSITPLVVNNQVVAVLHQALSNDLVSQRISQYALFVFSLALAGMAICYILISILLNEVILKNLYKLKRAAQAIQKGDLNTQISITSNDEIGEFAENFDAMRSQINTAQVKLEHYNKQLEELVAERTTQLESKLDELERMNKLMVGREIKMTELKKRITELEKT